MKVGLVLEGGAMRGLFTCGVTDVMMENKINIDTIIGTSAGAVFGVNYFSNQIGRVLRYNKTYCKDKRYISVRNLITTGNIVSKKFTYYDMPLKYDIFYNDIFMDEIKKGKKFIATATDVKTGKAVYFDIKDPVEQIEELRASASMPIVSKFVKINDELYLDGGVADSIPLERLLKEDLDKIIVVLTQPLDFRKKAVSSKKFKLAKLKYKKYPNLVKAIKDRHIGYNETLDKILELEKEKKIFVIRPESKININVIERDPEVMQRVYDDGRKVAKTVLKDLKKYLKSK